VSDQDRRWAPLPLVREDETDCPVCGLGGAFAAAQHYDVCARCEWVDDPEAYAYPERRCDTNDDSLVGATRSWPERLVLRLAEAPLSTFGLTTRDDTIGGYDYLVDDVSVRASFSGTGWDLKASIGPWPAAGDWVAPLLSGVPETVTGRSRLYVCHLCGGYDEPSLTADVQAGADRVIWSRIGLEMYDYSPDGWSLDLRRGPAGFAFDAQEYRHVLISAFA
jgi:hypothetical protein